MLSVLITKQINKNITKDKKIWGGDRYLVVVMVSQVYASVHPSKCIH